MRTHSQRFTRLRSTRHIVPLLLVAAFAAGCSDDPSGPGSAAGITINDLVGSWIATTAVHTNNANSSEVFDIVAAGGEVRITMLNGGGTRTWVDAGAFQDEWDSAVTLSGNTLISDPVEDGRPTRTWEFTLVSGVLTLTDRNSQFDFTQTGATPVSTTEVVAFVRH